MSFTKTSFAGGALILLLFSGAVAQKRARPTAPNPNLLAAESYLRQRNYAKAIAALELVISVEPRSDERVYAMLMAAHSNSNEPRRALDVGRQALALYPTSPRLRKALGQMLLREDPLDPQIEGLLSGAVRTHPRDAEARYLYGQWACLNNRVDLCLAELNKALTLAPGNNQARMQILTLIGMAEERRGRVAPADAAFAEALRVNRQLSPPDSLAAFEYAKFLLNHARDAEALQVIEQILAWSPNFGPARFERAKHLAKKGQLNEAAREAEAALQDSATPPAQLRAVHAFLAKTYFTLGRESDAQKHEQFLQSPP